MDTLHLLVLQETNQTRDHCTDSEVDAMYGMRFIIFLAVLFLTPPPAHAVQYEWHDSKGVAHSLKELAGRPVILHFWASWCDPCRKELPELAVWRTRHPQVQFAAISLDQNMSDARNYLNQQQLSFPPLVGNMNNAMQLGVRGLPTTIVIGANGEIRQRLLGTQSRESTKFSREILTTLKL